MNFSPKNKLCLFFQALIFFFLINSLLSIGYKLYAETKNIKLQFNENSVIYSRQDDYDIVSMPEFSFIDDASKLGEPMMPVKTIRVLIPSGTIVKNVRIISKKEKELNGMFYIYPVQHPVLTGEQDDKKFVEPKKEIYESDKNYPGNLAEFKYESYFRQYHIVEIAVYPFQYLPKNRKLVLTTEIQFEIEYEQDSKYQSTERLRKNEKNENEIKDKLKKLVINPEDVSQNSTLYKSNSDNQIIAKSLYITSQPSAVEGQNVDYIIITSDELVTAFQRLADWKTKKGIVTVIKTVSWITENYSGCDIQEKIRHFIQDAYMKWGTDYILIGGDIDIIPARINSGQSFSPITDLYYSAIDPISNNWNSNGDHLFGESTADYTADIWVGRAPVHNNNEVNLFTDKIFTYERNSLAPSLPSSSYLTKILSLGGVVQVLGWNWYCGIYAKEQVNSIIPSWFSNWRMYEYEPTYGSYYSYDQMLTRSNAINKISEGFGIINHIDHSSQYLMSMGSKTGGGALSINDVENLTNGNQYSVVYSAGCEPGGFDFDCIGEHFILKNNGGAVAFIAPSRSVFTSDGNHHDERFFESLFNNDNFHIGQTLGMTWYSSHTANIYNLLGDPEMPIWTNTPQNLIVSRPSSIYIGENNFTVTISNLPAGQEALVCIKKGTEVYASGETTSGTITFSSTPDSPGNLNLTITSHNFNPYEVTIPVSQSSTAHLFAQNYTIDDDASGESNGNGNGTVDAGETIELPVTLKNNGSTSVNSITAALAAYTRGTGNPNPYITIIDGSKSFGNISAGSSVSCLDDFGFSVSTNCPDGEVIEFRLTITDASSNTWHETFYIQIGTPELQHTAHIVNGNLQASSTVSIAIEISNYGEGIARGISASLTSSSSYITSITGSPQTYGDINHNGSSQRSYNFVISSSYPSGHEEDLTFTFTISDIYGKTWTHDFELKRPNTPTNLSATALETSIALVWSKITDTDLKGYNVYRCTTPTGTYVKANNRLITGTSYFNDVGLETETMYYYKISAVDQSANESALTSYIETSTTIRYLTGWPINTNERIFSSPTLFDINNDGKLEIFATDVSANGKVYGWDHTGLELFDIDGNPTTLSGFAKINGAEFWSSPAIDDLDNDGTFELVVAGRYGNNTLYCWHIKDNDGNGNPDLYWTVNIGDACISSPVIGDIDGNGQKEIVIMSHNGQVHIRRFDGTTFSDPWKTIGGSIESYCTPVLADLDSDGDLEIIIGGNDGKMYVSHHNGSDYTGWPFDTGKDNLGSSPVVADLDGDGQYEIIFIAVDEPGQINARVYVKDENGNDKSGWSGGKPITNLGFIVLSSPAVGNLDGDGELEIVVGTGSNVYAWNHNGSNLTGWPKTGFNGTASSPMIANIDEIDGQEVIIGSADYKLYAWHADGTKVKGWPLITGDVIKSSPAVGDVNGDGNYEVVVSSYDGIVYIWDTKGTGEKNWPMFHKNAQHTGLDKKIINTVTLTNSTTWSGNIFILGTVTVNNNVSLNVLKGTNLYFSNGSSLVVNGTLNINGTEASNVVLDFLAPSISPINCIWAYAGSEVNISHAEIMNSALAVWASDAEVHIDHCNLHNMLRPVYFYNLQSLSYGSTITNTYINTSTYEGLWLRNCQAYFNNNKITNNSGEGLRLSTNSVSNLWRNTIENNFNGISLMGNCTVSLDGLNLINNNTYNGLYVYNNGIVYASFNNNTIQTTTGINVFTSYYSQVYAIRNFWGDNPPNPTKLYYDGTSTLDYSNWLTSDPGAGSTLLKAEEEKGLPSAYREMLAGKYEAAEKMFKKIITEKFNDIEARYALNGLGTCYRLCNKSGFKDYLDSELKNKITETKNDFNRLYLELYSDCLIKEGKYDQALDNLKLIRNSYSLDSESTKEMAFQEGIINLVYKEDKEKGKAILEKIKKDYPDDKTKFDVDILLTAYENRGYSLLSNWKPKDKSDNIYKDIEKDEWVPDKYGLEQNYPNPFNPVTVIKFSLPQNSKVVLEVYSILGEKVATLVNEVKTAGYHETKFDGSNLSSGIYVYRLIASSLETGEQFVKSAKMMLVK